MQRHLSQKFYLNPWGHMRKYNYTPEQFKEAVKTSTSIAQVLKKLNIIAAGGNYRTFIKLREQWKVDTSHFTGQSWLKNKTHDFTTRPIEDYLSNKYYIHSHKLRLRLIKEGYFQCKCMNCNLTQWLDNNIPLELHHIDGNHKNNNLSNLQLLCPNCHTLTKTYRGKNISNKVGSLGIEPSTPAL